jgi:hypothetical protein
MFCREQVVQLHRHRDEIHGRGAELITVGNGAPHFARAFQEDQGITTPMYVDPSRATYRALGMRRSRIVDLITGRTLLHAIRAMRAGFRQGTTQGDAFQLGGVLVVKPDGEVLMRYLGNEAGDHPPEADVLATLA